MSNLLNVALNVYNMAVPELINRGRQISDAVATNPGVFINPAPSISVVNSAINDLELAWANAVDGAKSKHALMRDKKIIVIKHLKNLANYVQFVADNDEQIVHLATLELKAKGIRNKPDFEVYLPDDDGAVGLRCRARKKTMYRWEYCKDPIANNSWVVGNTTITSSSFIGGLDSNVMYWFRVVLINGFGETPLTPLPYVTL